MRDTSCNLDETHNQRYEVKVTRSLIVGSLLAERPPAPVYAVRSGQITPTMILSRPPGRRKNLSSSFSSSSQYFQNLSRLWQLHMGLLLLLFTGVTSGAAYQTRFSGMIGNVTVTVGRDASLSCTVEDLGEHKVGWIHLKRQMIVAVHTRMISRISRYSVTHDSHKTWTLHITGVTEDDAGYYMCQVNTDPALSQVGLLEVVVPPNIEDLKSSPSEIQVREKTDVVLECSATGAPEPRIMWRREDGEMIVTNTRKPEVVHEGTKLQLHQVSRTHMGAYLCIASNGVPPSVSKRITLHVEFSPQIHVPNQLVGVPTGDNVTIECFVEAYPRAISYWVKANMMILNSDKYYYEAVETLYKIHMKLTIFNFSRNDNTTYKCVAKNSLGETEGDIKLNEIYMSPKAKEIRSENSKTEDETQAPVETETEEQRQVALEPPKGDQLYDNSPSVLQTPKPTKRVILPIDVLGGQRSGSNSSGCLLPTMLLYWVLPLFACYAGLSTSALPLSLRLC
ncbi:lachesin-like [Macrobrachium nipponense]|uniref:lachesin-like n=1 Tax=Macrobrachium nipponense TaxID=159736 RepID=UPI0030C81BF7